MRKFWSIAVPGVPIAQMRPRFVRRGAHVKAYNPQETEAGKFLLLARPYLPSEPLTGPLVVTIGAFFQRPKSHYRTGKNAALLKDTAPGPEQCEVAKDVDNIAKFVLDALNGVAWVDDRQICALHVSKEWTQTGPATIITISEGEGEEWDN